MSNKNPEQFSPEVMRQFTGSEHWYRGTESQGGFYGRCQACR